MRAEASERKKKVKEVRDRFIQVGGGKGGAATKRVRRLRLEKPRRFCFQEKREAHRKEAKKKRYISEGQSAAQTASALTSICFELTRKETKKRKAMMMD